jgi:hypothetical protein
MRVEIEGIGPVEFEDGTPQDVIDRTVKQIVTESSPAQKRVNEMPWQVRGLAGIGEAGLQAITGLGSTVAGGIAGLAKLGVGSDSPGDTVRKVQEFGTYQPRTAQGQRASDLLSFIPNAYTKAVHAGGDAIRGDSAGGLRDFLGTTFDVVGEGAPVGLGGVAALRAAAKAPPPLSPRQQALSAAQKEGYTVPPSLMDQRSYLEGLGGKARTAQLHSAKNADVTAKIAARELGFPEGTTLTPELLAKSRKTVYDQGYVPLKQRQAPLVADQTYWDEVGAPAQEIKQFRQSFPDVGSGHHKTPQLAGADELVALSDGMMNVNKISFDAAVERIRQLRFDASKNLKAFDDPAKSRLGHAQKAAAKSLEDLMERNLVAAGDQASLTKFRMAREYIAKSHTVEDAMNPVTGAVHARDLAKSDAPMKGGLKTAADFATAFPRAVQKAESFGGTPPISPLDSSMAAIMGATGAAATGGPGGLLAGGLPLLRPLAAPVTRAPFVQNSLVRNKPPLPPQVGLLPLLDPSYDKLR